MLVPASPGTAARGSAVPATDERESTMTAPFRFVHCSDVHLDAPFRCASDAVRARLADAGRTAFQRVVDLCVSEKVHALLVAGDLFDDERLSFSTEEFLLAQVSRLTAAGIHVVLASGNHDPGGDGSRAAAVGWPGERFSLVRGGTWEDIAIRGEGGRIAGRVLAVGHATSAEAASLLASFNAPRHNDPAVALLHAHVAEADGSGNHPRLAPATVPELAALGCRYVALGHLHRRQQLGGHPIHYPGTLCGHHAGETGAQGALLVSVPAKGEAHVAFRPLAPVRWESLPIPSLHEIRDSSALKLAAASAFEAIRGAPDVLPGQEWMLTIPLEGPCPIALDLQEDDLLDELSEELAAELLPHGVIDVRLRDESTSLPCDPAQHRGQPHVLGLSLDVIDALAEDGKLLAHLPTGPLAGLAGSASGEEKRSYLRSLLAGLPGAAVEALLKETLA